jgi:hypothetical protein
MSYWVVLLLGVVLCFFGIASVHLATLAAGFAVCWLLAEAFGAGPGTALLIAACGALLTWLVVAVVFRVVTFFLGALLGAVIGANVFTLVDDGDASLLLALILVPSVALACGFLAGRFRRRFLLWATALGGAALVVDAVARLLPSQPELHDPGSSTQLTVATVAWLAVAVAGWLTQRALFARQLQKADR